jgi:hypothetical protein
MSDLKKAELALAKLDAQVAQAGLQIVSGPNHSHDISGLLDGTHTLTATQSLVNGKDTFDFSILAGHNFNLTIAGFNPLFWSGSPPSQSQLIADPVHDLLALRFDPSTGVTNQAQALADESVQQVAHDVVLSIHTAAASGTITFQGLADLVPPNETEHFSWLNIIPPTHVG